MKFYLDGDGWLCGQILRLNRYVACVEWIGETCGRGSVNITPLWENKMERGNDYLRDT